MSEQLFQGILGGGESEFNLRVPGTGAGYNMIKVLQGTKENRNGGLYPAFSILGDSVMAEAILSGSKQNALAKTSGRLWSVDVVGRF